jgi:hypothetical protein
MALARSFAMVDFPHEECPSIAIVIFFISLETYFSAKVMKKTITHK